MNVWREENIFPTIFLKYKLDQFYDVDELGLFYQVQMLVAYGFDENMLCYIYSYLKSRKHCVSQCKQY